MNLVDNECRDGVSGEWGHENQRDHRGRQDVIFAKLFDVSIRWRRLSIQSIRTYGTSACKISNQSLILLRCEGIAWKELTP